MGGDGRNQRCCCGSTKTTDRCCGVTLELSDTEMAKSFLATESRQAALRLILLSEDERLDLFDGMLDLPGRHASLQLALPEPLHPELDGLRGAMDADVDPDAANERLAAALGHIDTPVQRADLARAVLALVAGGDLNPAVADAALLDLDCYPTSALLRTSLLRSLGVPVGARDSRARFLVASR